MTTDTSDTPDADTPPWPDEARHHPPGPDDSDGMAVCVYCASGDVPQRYRDMAAAVGTAVAERGWTLVSGGGNVSMMGAVVTAARAAGGRTFGVIPQALVDREVADRDSTTLRVVTTMRERKQAMDDASDAFLALPGGIGTLEELTEAWTGAYLGMHDKPVVLLDPDGFYEGFLSWCEGLRREGFVSDRTMECLVVARTVDEALAACRP